MLVDGDVERSAPCRRWFVAVPAGPPPQPLAGAFMRTTALEFFPPTALRHTGLSGSVSYRPLLGRQPLHVPARSPARPRLPLHMSLHIRRPKLSAVCVPFRWPTQPPPPRDESEYVTVAERPQGLKIVRPPIWRRPRRHDDEGKSTFNAHHDAMQSRIAAEVVRFPALPSAVTTVFQTSYGFDAPQFKASADGMCVADHSPTRRSA